MTGTSPISETIRFPITGMTCASCVNRITRSIRRLNGVTTVSVDLGNETATVRREPALVSEIELAAAVTDAGYEADLASAVTIPNLEPRNIVERLLRRPK